MNTGQDILTRIIDQAISQYKSWRIEPLWLSVENNERQVTRNEILPQVAQAGPHIYSEVSKTIQLDNNVLLLTSRDIDIPISATLTLESHDNLFTITRAEYCVTEYYKYQVFSNYLKISLKDYGNYVPFRLEFLRIVPTL
jgi:hypothetical protein